MKALKHNGLASFYAVQNENYAVVTDVMGKAIVNMVFQSTGSLATRSLSPNYIFKLVYTKSSPIFGGEWDVKSTLTNQRKPEYGKSLIDAYLLRETQTR